MPDRVAVDIGGTFTDAVAIDGSGIVRTSKFLTTPGRLQDGVMQAVAGLGVDWPDVETFVHGTTAGLNAFLERRGATVALLTTAGFRDVYELGRASRPEMYNLRFRPPTPLVPRHRIHEVTERLGADGSVVVPLDEAALKETLARLDPEVEAVAVVFLHSYENSDHEARAAELVGQARPDLAVVSSHDVAPEWREYERTATTVLSAYIAPIVDEYLWELDANLVAQGLGTPLRVMQSNGGVMTAGIARSKPIQTLFSGPVGGAIAGAAVASDLADNVDGIDRLICVDMGGTSFDVSLVIDGTAEVEPSSTIEGHPIIAPTVSIHTIGAGGGSVVSVAGGGLRVGPESAGAVPGPACYGAGGTAATVTDANLLLGRLPAVARLGGSMQLDRAASQRAVAAIAQELGLGLDGLAEGIVAVADAAMANAIREITVHRGIDPRDFSLLAFGGAGPLHAVSIAEELDLPRVVVPADPGVFSAYGMLRSDPRHDVVRSFFRSVAAVPANELAANLAELEAEVAQLLDRDGIGQDRHGFEPSADLRYAGQEYTVTVALDTRATVQELLASLSETFAHAHQSRYGHSNPSETVEFVNLRMTGFGRGTHQPRSNLPEGAMPEPVSNERVRIAGQWHETAVHERANLPAGARLQGPAVVLEDACTTLVPPNWTAMVSPQGHLVMERSA